MRTPFKLSQVRTPPPHGEPAVRETARPHLNPLGVVDERGEDDDAENEEENEEHQLLGRGPEGLDQDLESGRVSGQLEEPQDSDDGEELEHVGVLQVGGQLLEHQVDVEAERGDVVDDVDAERQRKHDYHN